MYNSENFISESIDSIINQSYDDFELIIIDDASYDHSCEIIEKKKDARIILLQNETNCGVARSLNKGYACANGEFIARMDSDDISCSKRFEKQIQYMETHPEIGVLGTGIQFIGARNGKKINPINPEANKVNLLFNSCLAHPSVMMRRSILTDSPYNPNWEGMEDYELWWRLSFKTGISNLSDSLLKYRIHAGQVTQTLNKVKADLYRNFRKKQIVDLGVTLSDLHISIFHEFCTTGKVFSQQNLLILLEIFEQIEISNSSLKQFPQKYLHQLFSDIANTQISRWSIRTALGLSRQTVYSNFLFIILNKLKHFICQ